MYSLFLAAFIWTSDPEMSLGQLDATYSISHLQIANQTTSGQNSTHNSIIAWQPMKRVKSNLAWTLWFTTAASRSYWNPTPLTFSSGSKTVWQQQQRKAVSTLRSSYGCAIADARLMSNKTLDSKWGYTVLHILVGIVLLFSPSVKPLTGFDYKQMR